MEKLDVAMHDEGMANPFGIRSEGPMQRCMAAIKHEPKAIGSSDVNGLGSRGGD